MLVLTRKKDQSIVIGDNIEVTVLEIQGEQVRIGVKAPKSVSVHRKEIYLEIQEENRRAAEIGNVELDAVMRNAVVRDAADTANNAAKARIKGNCEK